MNHDTLQCAHLLLDIFLTWVSLFGLCWKNSAYRYYYLVAISGELDGFA